MRAIVIATAVSLLPVSLCGQWLDFRTPGIPRTAEGSPTARPKHPPYTKANECDSSDCAIRDAVRFGRRAGRYCWTVWKYSGKPLFVSRNISAMACLSASESREYLGPFSPPDRTCHNRL